MVVLFWARWSASKALLVLGFTSTSISQPRGTDYFSYERMSNFYIQCVCKKLRLEQQGPSFIRAVPGGYNLNNIEADGWCYG
jgi:hypothetical protein